MASILAVVAVVGLILVLTDEDEQAPTVPAGAVAVIEDAPSGLGEISKAEFQQRLAEIALAYGTDIPPKPGETAYVQFAPAAMEGLLERVWTLGQAEELGLSLSDEELAAEVKKVKDENFKSEAEFQKTLHERHKTQADYELGIKKEALEAKIEEWESEHTPEPSDDQIEAYFNALMAEYKPKPEERTFRFIINKDRAKAERALALVGIHNGTFRHEWTKAARLYSEDPKTKNQGGLQTAQEDELPQPLAEVIFGAKHREPILPEGPVETSEGFVVFQLDTVTPANEKPSLEKMEDTIRHKLRPAVKDKYLSDFNVKFGERWGARTFCAPEFGIELCANYAFPLHPGDCISSESEKPTALPCVQADVKLVARAKSTEECEHGGVEFRTKINRLLVFCTTPLHEAEKAPRDSQK
jgi:parvulin-like peptidyl-prolyl isomerase